jgi:hypothetical protein
MTNSTTPLPYELYNISNAPNGQEQHLVMKRAENSLREIAAQGVRRGRPQRCPRSVVVDVVDAHLAGRSMRTIAEMLNTRNVPTPGGGQRWYSSHVHRLLQTQTARELIGDRNQNMTIKKGRKGSELSHELPIDRSSAPGRIPAAIPPMWSWALPEEMDEDLRRLTTAVKKRLY